MQVSAYGKQQMPPRTFWGAVLVVSLGLGVMGLYFLKTGDVPTIPRWWYWAILAFTWSSALISLLRNGRKVLVPLYGVSLIGCTLAFGSKLAPPELGAVRTWGENIGYILLFGCTLAPYLQFGRRRAHSAARPAES